MYCLIVRPTSTNVAYAIKNLHGKIPCKIISKTSIPLPATPVITVTKLFLVETTGGSIITNFTTKNTNWQKFNGRNELMKIYHMNVLPPPSSSSWSSLEISSQYKYLVYQWALTIAFPPGSCDKESILDNNPLCHAMCSLSKSSVSERSFF